jgi:hypothetical protein
MSTFDMWAMWKVHVEKVMDSGSPNGQRKGQYLFNFLAQYRPDITDQARGTDVDPFYDDTKLIAFLDFVDNHWGLKG